MVNCYTRGSKTAQMECELDNNMESVLEAIPCTQGDDSACHAAFGSVGTAGRSGAAGAFADSSCCFATELFGAAQTTEQGRVLEKLSATLGFNNLKTERVSAHACIRDENLSRLKTVMMVEDKDKLNFSDDPSVDFYIKAFCDSSTALASNFVISAISLSIFSSY